MDSGWAKLKSMVAGGTPNIAESTLKNILMRGKDATVLQHRYLEGWRGMPKDIAAIIIVVRGPATLDNVDLLIEEMQRNLPDGDIEYLWTHIPDKTVSANAIVIHGRPTSLKFDYETGLLTINRKFLVKLVKQHSGWKPGMYHLPPEIKKVKIV